MRYLKSFLFCFFIVFFVDYLIPGVDVVSFSKVPFIKGDILFPAILALANISIPFIYKILNKNLSKIKMGISLLFLNIIGYSLLKFLNAGVYITTIEGYLFSFALVTVGCFFVLCFMFPNNKDLECDKSDNSDKAMFGDF